MTTYVLYVAYLTVSPLREIRVGGLCTHIQIPAGEAEPWGGQPE